VLLRQAYVTWVLVGVGGGVEVAENTPLVLHLVVLWPVGVALRLKQQQQQQQQQQEGVALRLKQQQ